MSEPSARLYFICPPIPDAAIFAPRLDAALGAGDVACVLFAGEADADPDALANLVRQVQARNVAALIANDLDLAEHLQADGVHALTIDDLSRARRRSKTDRIAGVGGLASRDQAMEAGEIGADYVMFGEAAEPFAERLDRVAWWAEIFQVPCVAVVHDVAEIEPFVAAGAEFVALGDAVWSAPDGPEPVMAEAMRALAAGHDAFMARRAETA